jgi:malate dehydrogenase
MSERICRSLIPKISVIGAGYVGEAAARHLITREVGDVYLFDIMEDVAKGKALDLYHAAPIIGTNRRIYGVNVAADGDGSEYAALEDSDVVIITSGIARRPGMSRDDLLKINAKIVRDVADKVQKYAPNTIVIVVTNPLDVMSKVAFQTLGWHRDRVLGQAGVLDSSRMASLIAAAVPCSATDVDAIVLGGHGDTMVPLVRYTTVGGIPVSELLSKEQIDEIIQKTAFAGGEVVQLFRNSPALGSAYHAPGAAVAQMAEAIIRDQMHILPTTVHLEGEYGYEGIYMGVPVQLCNSGIRRVIELELQPHEREMFEKSANHVKKTTQEMQALLGL